MAQQLRTQWTSVQFPGLPIIPDPGSLRPFSGLWMHLYVCAYTHTEIDTLITKNKIHLLKCTKVWVDIEEDTATSTSDFQTHKHYKYTHSHLYTPPPQTGELNFSQLLGFSLFLLWYDILSELFYRPEIFIVMV